MASEEILSISYNVSIITLPRLDSKHVPLFHPTADTVHQSLSKICCFREYGLIFKASVTTVLNRCVTFL